MAVLLHLTDLLNKNQNLCELILEMSFQSTRECKKETHVFSLEIELG